MKPKFDGYAAQYDAWFMENENLFQSELRLFQKVLGDIQGKRVLSVGCGSGLFESMIDCSGIEGHRGETGGECGGLRRDRRRGAGGERL